jgi:hypothetical protein
MEEREMSSKKKNIEEGGGLSHHEEVKRRCEIDDEERSEAARIASEKAEKAKAEYETKVVVPDNK